MPIYEYACEKCGHEFEREQRITEDPIKTCPACRAARARRLISRTSFVLKGGGWYNDLYSSANQPKQDGEAKAAGSEAKDAGSEAKDAGSTAKDKSEKKKDKPSGDAGKSDTKPPKSGSGPKAAA